MVVSSASKKIPMLKRVMRVVKIFAVGPNLGKACTEYVNHDWMLIATNTCDCYPHMQQQIVIKM